MNPRAILSRISLYTCVAAVLCTPALALDITKELATGLTLTQSIETDPASIMVVNVLSADLNNASLDVKAALAQDVILDSTPNKGREFVSTLVGRKDALAGINADFFPFTGDPLGTCIINGEFVSEPYNGRAVMGITKSRTVVFDNPRFEAKMTLPNGISRQIEGINRLRETNQIICYTDTFGASTRSEKFKSTDIVFTTPDLPVQLGKPLNLIVSEVRTDALDTPIPKGGVILSGGGAAGYFLKENLKVGDGVTVQFDLKSASNIDWLTVRDAVGGGPRLVKDGKVALDTVEEGFAFALETARHPRTAVGVTADNKLLMVTVDGRQSISAGIDLRALAALMIKLGAVNAMNMDGGGSSTMSVGGMVINSPCEFVQRPVADMLLVITTDKKEELPKLAITGVEPQVSAGTNTQLFLTWGDDKQILTPDQLNHVVWGTTNGVGFVNQAGYFIPMKARKGTVEAFQGGRKVSLEVTVTAGEPTRIETDLKPNTLDTVQSTFSITVTDQYGNLVTGKEVAFTVIGGKADAEKGVTDDKGKLSVGVTWEPTATERSVKASIGALEAAWVCLVK